MTWDDESRSFDRAALKGGLDDISYKDPLDDLILKAVSLRCLLG
jgi:hypothetical protein